MSAPSHMNLSRRERQIMDIIYRQEQATAMEIHEQLPNPPSYSAVRALLRVLEDKGHLRHSKKGAKYVYHPTRSRRSAARSALRRVTQTFFAGSTEQVVAALLDLGDSKLTSEELARLSELIDQAKQNGR